MLMAYFALEILSWFTAGECVVSVRLFQHHNSSCKLTNKFPAENTHDPNSFVVLVAKQEVYEAWVSCMIELNPVQVTKQGAPL